MRRIPLLLVLLALFGIAAFSQSIGDYWMPVANKLEVLVRQSVFDGYTANFGTDMTATLSAAANARIEAQQRAEAAVTEICNHDPVFCADVFTRYGLRLRQD